MSVEQALALRVADVSKRFGPVQALLGVSLEVALGEVAAIVGVNGAGKSTLVKILAGVYVPDEGDVAVGGVLVHSLRPADATRYGLAFVHQEPAFVPQMTALENIALAVGFPTRLGQVKPGLLRPAVDGQLSRLGMRCRLDVPASALSASERAALAIVRALIQEAKVVVLDEPTASLGLAEADHLLGTVRTLAGEGVAVVYVTQRLDEVARVADSATVLREGRVVARLSRDQLDGRALTRHMVGELAGATKTRAPTVSRAEGETPFLVARSFDGENEFVLHKGEVVGLAGMAGSGRSELARALVGLASYDGEFVLGGTRYAPRSLAAARERGVILLSQGAALNAIFTQTSVAENVSFANWPFVSRWKMIHRRRQVEFSQTLIERLDIRPGIPNYAAGSLSTGNRQKLALARWLPASPQLLVCDEPTQGVDILGKGEILHHLRELASSYDSAILVISSEFRDLLEICDRILIMHAGRIGQSVDVALTTFEELTYLVHSGTEALRTNDDQVEVVPR